MPSYEYNYNADQLNAIGTEVEGAKTNYPNGWYNDPEIYTLPVWWDSTK